MTDLATHIRIFDVNPSDELVQKRQRAIEDVATQFQSVARIDQILPLANNLAGALATKGIMPSTLANIVETAIKKESPAFVQAGHELQLVVCAILAALTILESSPPSTTQVSRADILAVGLWSALAFQKPRSEQKIEALRRELLDRAEELVLRSANSGRQRSSVPDASFAPIESEAWAGIAATWQTGPFETLNALRFNAALDREEIDLLWWALSDWSALLQSRLSALNPESAAIASAIEAARLLKRFPAEAHKHLVLRHVTRVTNLSLGELIKSIGDHKTALAQAHAGNSTLTACPHIFPLLTALSESQVLGSGAKESRSTMEWGSRALLEASILRVASLPTMLT
jgi:hypothetical protein